MLRSREWKPQTFQTPPTSPFYSFLLDEKNVTMTAVGISSLHYDAIDPTDENYEWVCPDQELAAILVATFKQVPQVKWICAEFGENRLSTWTLLESYDREARGNIYQKEMELCKAVRSCDFDFRVTSEELVSPEELESAGWRIIYKRP
jgi:hypothetical protein